MEGEMLHVTFLVHVLVYRDSAFERKLGCIPPMLNMIPCSRSSQIRERLSGADVKIKCDARRLNLLMGRFRRWPNLACQILRFSDTHSFT